MAVNALPLLHKYVLSPEDDKDLTLAKLKYRLCVKEVCEVLISRAQEKGFEPSSQQATTVDDDSSFHVNPTLKWEDSGIGTDESVSEDLRSPQHNDNIFRITEEPSINDISRQPDSISDEAFHPPASSFLSSPSTSSSDSCEESEETEKPSYPFSRNGENFDNGENNGEREFFENVYTDAKDSVAPIHISSCFGNQVEEHLHEEENEEEMEEEEDEEAFVPVMSSTLESRMDESTDDRSPVDEIPPHDLTIQSQGDDANISPRGTNDRCTDVDEALRILLTHKELPQINSRKAASTWSWNAADIARGPQKVSLQTEGNAEQQESQAKRNSSNQLRATHEKILIKDKKLADIYRKIKERDEEDQRMVKELLKKQTIPFAEPLPVVLPPKPAPPPPETIRPQEPIETIRPAPVEKAVVADVKPKEDSSASARKTLTRGEEPARKRKNGNVFQNVVHSLQRRFSTKRNRESTTAAS